MPEEKDAPRFDQAAMEFPMERVTLGQMRRCEPRVFRSQLLHELALEVEAFAGHYWEQVLAEKAFARATGQPDPHPRTDRSEAISILNEAYKSYGISSGIQQTRLLARQIEAAAVEQARKCLGQLR